MLFYVICAIFGLGVLFFLFLVAAFSTSIQAMADGIELVPVNVRDAHPELLEGVEECGQWAVAQGFQEHGAFHTTIGGAECMLCVWRHDTRPTFLVRYHVVGQVYYDLVTLFLGNRALTTASSRDSQSLPKPNGEYLQSFDLEPDGLLTRHAEAEDYLMREAGFQEQWVQRPMQELIEESVTRQALYVQSFPLWQLRGVWWYFTRRDKMHNRPIQELHECGLAPFPKDPDYRPFDG